MFTPKIGEDEPIFDFRIFFNGVGEKPPTREQTAQLCKRFFQHIFERILIYKPATTPPIFYGSDLSSF